MLIVMQDVNNGTSNFPEVSVENEYILCMAGALCYAPETITTLLITYTPI